MSNMSISLVFLLIFVLGTGYASIFYSCTGDSGRIYLRFCIKQPVLECDAKLYIDFERVSVNLCGL